MGAWGDGNQDGRGSPLAVSRTVGSASLINAMAEPSSSTGLPASNVPDSSGTTTAATEVEAGSDPLANQAAAGTSPDHAAWHRDATWWRGDWSDQQWSGYRWRGSDWSTPVWGNQWWSGSDGAGVATDQGRQMRLLIRGRLLHGLRVQDRDPLRVKERPGINPATKAAGHKAAGDPRGWSHRRYWVQAIRRWDKMTDLPLGRRAEKVLRGLGWELQPDLEHIPEHVLSSGGYLDAILAVIDMKAGVREDDEKREAFRSLFYQSQRRREETLAQYAMRKQQDFLKASTFGIAVPPGLQVMLMREGALLSDQNQQNLTALLQGQDEDPHVVAKWLSRMDVRADRLHGFAEDEPLGDGGELNAYGEEEDIPDESDDLEDAAVLAELDGLDLSEDQVNEVFAVIEQHKKKRTWKENKLYKAELRKDRGTISKGGDRGYHHRGGAGSSGSGNRRGQLSRDELKKISKCRLCHKKGHWAEDCHLNRDKGKDKGAPSGFCYAPGPTGGSGAGSGFSFLSLEEIHRAVTVAKERLGNQGADGSWTFLSLKAGEAILDIGATQDLIGNTAMQQLTRELSQQGLRPVTVDVPVPSPSGIGGAAKVLKVMLVPISPAGAPGILQMTVLEENIPPLLSVGFLEFLKTCIDLEEDSVSFRRLGVKMSLTRQPSGHRTIPLTQWGGGRFPVPEEILRKYKVSADAFHCQLSTVLNQFVWTMWRALRFMPPRDPERGTQLWRVMVQRMLFVVEAARISYMRLILSERAKSSKSERRKYLENPSHEPASCLHPVDRHLRRGNQYGSWKVCGVCGARLEYHKRSKAKAKAKGRSQAASSVAAPVMDPEQVMERPSRSRGSEGYRPMRAAGQGSLEAETLSTMQAMLKSFQDQSRVVSQAMGNISRSLEELSKGQGQLLLMAQDSLEKPIWRAWRDDDPDLDEPRWMKVENPNEQSPVQD
ncbi:unnamed protein product [Symbiodinium sp. CCMP2592]|nr:unnamed protein product [Symbiodinium sp. CCMP2592]